MSTEILIIDDNPDIRNILKDLISDAGFETRVAANYNQALNEIDKKLPDVAIIDVKLDKGDNDGIELLSHIKNKNKDIAINFYSSEVHYVNSDIEQLNRVFINLFKNSIESLKEKYEKKGFFQKKIDVEIQLINDYISIVVQDNGTGFTNNDLKTLSKPYFTTKKEGSGLGLSIVEKILNDHNGFIEFISQKEGAKIKILLPKYVN